jgi:hypothetical protein
MLASIMMPLLLPYTAKPAVRPHILLMVADDYGWNDVSFHANRTSSANPDGEPTDSHAIRTPSLAQLASEGVRLEAYYVQPVCSPTRGAIMSGRYPSHTGIGPNVIPPAAPYGMPAGETLLPELLSQTHSPGAGAGAPVANPPYRTAALGKWHLGFCDERYTPTYRGFDSFTGYLNGAEECVTPHHHRCSHMCTPPWCYCPRSAAYNGNQISVHCASPLELTVARVSSAAIIRTTGVRSSRRRRSRPRRRRPQRRAVRRAAAMASAGAASRWRGPRSI